MKTSLVLLAALTSTVVNAIPAPKKLELKGLIRTRPAPSDLLAHLKASNPASFAATSTVNSTTSSMAAPNVTAPHSNPWMSLTSAEAAEVVSYLHNQTALNITAAQDATTWDNWIGVVELAPPNKTAVLDFFANKTEAPARYAKVLIQFQATEEPYIEEFVVGPIGSGNLSYRPYVEGSTREGSIRQRNYDADADEVYTYLQSQCEDVKDVIQGILGSPYDAFDLWGIDPLWHEEGRVVYWIGFWGVPEVTGDFETLLPSGLYMKIDMTGRNRDGWRLVGWLHNGIYYTSSAAFAAAYAAPDFVTPTQNLGVNGSWGMTDRAGPELPYDTRAPPMQVLPEGNRYAVDTKDRYVEWMDFSFYIGFSRDTAVRLHNIKYKGETIMYELGLVEALAHYAGNDPVQSGVGYIDSYYGEFFFTHRFGPFAFQLLEGYDCPHYATMLPATWSENEVTVTHPAAICLYEQDEGTPMQRHASSAYVAATKNIVFTLRSVSTVGNYDYSFDYNFYMDGSIETVVRASGYIQSAFHAKNEDYGYQIQDGLSGSMHDHTLTFKADLDILGTANTFVTHTIVPTTEKYVWSNTTRSTMKLQRGNISNEDESKLQWTHNAQSMYIVANLNETNKYGEPRGWRLMPSRGGAGMHSTITNSSNLFASQSFATHALYVTKHHDNEQSCSHSTNSYDPRNPVVDFSKYFDSEDLIQEDLVLWYNLGMHHVPHTGDIPNTVHTTAVGAMIFSPHNYLVSDPSRQTAQMLRINYNSSAPEIVSDVLTFGSHQFTGAVNASAVDYYSYVGDSRVRKMPYDPLHPYNETESIV